MEDRPQTDKEDQTRATDEEQSSTSSSPPTPPNHEDYIVQFEDHDEWNPLNWPTRKKLYIFGIGCYTCLCSTFASAVWSPATEVVGQAFGVSSEVGILVTSLFVLGYAFGPLIWGPLSELSGRRIPIVVAMFGFTCFAAGAATGKDLQTVLLCRFFTGVMGSCPLSVIAGVFSDIFDHAHRGTAIALFSLCIFLGPILAPFIGGFTIMNQGLGWRFNGYWNVIMGALSFIMSLFFLPETYAPVVLAKKAAQLRKKTGNWALRAKHEEIDVNPKELMVKYFTRPIKMLIKEPVLFAVSFYMSFIYAILYLFFTAYPIVFQGVYKFNPGEGGLPFFALGVGVIAACTVAILLQPSYSRKLAANHHIPNPDWRLPQVILGGVSFAVGIFWFGWTGFTPRIHWIVPTLSGLATGFGFISIFMPLFNYIIDMYLMYAASAISANTFMRSFFGAGFPMFATYMFNGLGIGLTATVLGCVAAALVPVPVLFYFYGDKLRRSSKFAPNKKPKETETDEEKGH